MVSFLRFLEHVLYFVFLEDGRSGMFVIGNEQFPAYLLDLPAIVESYKTYDDSVLIKTADIGQVHCLALSMWLVFFVNWHDIVQLCKILWVLSDDYG